VTVLMKTKNIRVNIKFLGRVKKRRVKQLHLNKVPYDEQERACGGCMGYRLASGMLPPLAS
jgi:hypothetical protein